MAAATNSVGNTAASTTITSANDNKVDKKVSEKAKGVIEDSVAHQWLRTNGFVYQNEAFTDRVGTQPNSQHWMKILPLDTEFTAAEAMTKKLHNDAQEVTKVDGLKYYIYAEGRPGFTWDTNNVRHISISVGLVPQTWENNVGWIVRHFDGTDLKIHAYCPIKG